MVLTSPAPKPGTPRMEGWTKTVFPAMGTQCQIVFRAPSQKQAASFREAVIAWVRDFENKYSRFKADSVISAINRAAGERWMETDAELDAMLSLCDWYYWSTGGVFDPTWKARFWAGLFHLATHSFRLRQAFRGAGAFEGAAGLVQATRTT